MKMYSAIFECCYSTYRTDKFILYILNDFVKHHAETEYVNKHNLHHNLVQDAKRTKLFSQIRRNLEKTYMEFQVKLIEIHVVTEDQIVDDCKHIYEIRNGLKVFRKKDLCEIDRNGFLIKEKK